MRVYVTPGDGLPLYRQIVNQVVELIAGGQLAPGDRLASHRELATQIVVAPLTVKKAYDELERLGYVRQQRGRGTFVAARPPVLSEKKAIERVRATARQLAGEAALAGLSLTRLIDLLREERSRLGEERSRHETA